MNRRTFLHGSLLTTFATSIPRAAFPGLRLPLSQIPQGSANPMRLISSAASTEFNGDDISRPHDILWNKAGYLASKGGAPAASETVPVVVIGGGVAGLSAAYFLKDLKPVVLEQAPQFGGNSKGERIGNTDFSIGAAYLVKPDAGSSVEALLQDLSLLPKTRMEKGEDTSVFFAGKFQKPFWSGVTDPQAAKEFERVHKVFAEILENQYPDIPLTGDSAISREVFQEWDSITFEQWMKKNLGAVHPHVEEYLQLYAWSSFCASLSELSAAQMLNFITSEADSILALPGGNAAITEKLYSNLKASAGEENLRASCFVLDVTPNEKGVQIVYEDGNRNLKTIQAQACVFASPKFVAPKVINGLAKEQQQAIEGISYRAYVVANVLLKNKIQSPTYELYDLKGKVPELPMAMNPGDRKFTDICFGSWANEAEADRGVVTVYKALPFDGARQFLFSPFAHDKNKRQIESQIPEVLQALNLKESDIDGIRMTRWGHSLPVAKAGAISSGQAELAARTIDQRIVFANQDNWLNPSFEVAFSSAESAASEVRALLAKK